MKNKRTFLLGLITGSFLGLVLVAGFFIPLIAHGVTIEEVGGTIGLGTSDLKQVVINIIKWILGVMSLVVVIMIIYGGFIWMTAGGNVEKVKKAKKIITRAVIGLVIVLLAWAIVLFVVRFVTNSTGGPGIPCAPEGSTFDCQRCSAGVWVSDISLPGCLLPGTETFHIDWAWPPDGATDVPLCSIVQAKFNGNINPATVAGNVHVRIDGGAEVPGVWTVPAPTPNVLKFDPTSDFSENTVYEVEVTNSLREAPPSTRPTRSELWHFTTGTTTLSVPPYVTTINPSDGATQICLMTPVQSIFGSAMDVSTINSTSVLLTQGGNPVSLGSIDYPNVYSYSTRPAAILSPGLNYNITLKSGVAGIKDVCGNELDGNENGTSQGAPADDFLAAGNPRFTNEPWDFTTDTDTTNVECKPEITSINPNFGRYDDSNTVSITGSNFGITGNVFFNQDVIDQSNCFNLAAGPSQYYPLNNCVANWNNTNINIRVPGGPVKFDDGLPSAGARDGGTKVVIGAGPNDTSNAMEFNVVSPQINRALGLNSQPHGGLGQYVTIFSRGDYSDGFGNTAGTVYFRNKTTHAELAATLPCGGASWSNGQVIVKVSDLSGIGVPACAGAWTTCVGSASEVGIQLVKSDGSRSNIVNFIYTNEQAGPGLCQIQPNSCGVGNDIRNLIGENFGVAGAPQNAVYFTKAPNPPASATINNWNTTQIGIRVPNLTNANGYEVTVRNPIGWSNPLLFNVPCGGVPAVVEDSYCASICIGGSNPNAPCSTNDQCPNGGVCSYSAYASPNPFKGLTNVCLNIEIRARFSTRIDDTDINDTNVFMQKCDDDSCSVISDPTHIAGALSVILINPTQEGFGLVPAANLDANTTYQVTVTNNVRSEAGVRMNNDYQWHFKTKGDTGNCPIERVVVDPANVTLPNIGDTQNYTSGALGPNCTLLNPTNYTWAWSSDNSTIASVTGSATNNETATAVNRGATYINAEAENKKGSGYIKVDPDACVFDPNRCPDPIPGNGVVECPGSVCNLAIDKCEPVITNLSPAAGPKGTFVTIRGCYFEPAQGNGYVTFGSEKAEFKCDNGWGDSQIVATVPLGASSGLNGVVVTTNSVRISNSATFDIRTTCESGAAVPGTGMPGLCPPLSPPAGREGTLVTFNGYNLTSGTPATGTVAQFTGSAGFINSSSGQGNAGGTSFANAAVPVGALPGDAQVAVLSGGLYCASNPINFNISCNDNSECSTDCCLNNICRVATACSPGGPGDPCRLPANNPLCQVGPQVADTNYRCIDQVVPVGHRDPVIVGEPPPAPAGYPPLPGNDCRACCYPGQTMGSLSCSANKGNCTDVGRGLYCGNKANVSEHLCQDPPLTIGTFLTDGQFCCEGRPTIGPITASNCRNGSISVQFSQAMDRNSFNASNILVYPQSNVTTINGSNYASLEQDVPGSFSTSGTAVQSTNTGRANYTFNPGANGGSFILTVETSQAGANDLAKYGIYHHLIVFLDNAQIGDIWNLATGDTAGHQVGAIELPSLSPNLDHSIGIRWDNDWCDNGCAGGLDSNIRLYNIKLSHGSLVGGSISGTGNGFTFNPGQLLDANQTYYVLIHGGARGTVKPPFSPDNYLRDQGVKNSDGVYLWDSSRIGADTSNIDRIFSFTTSDKICRVDHLEVDIRDAAGTKQTTSNLYNCAADNCSDDLYKPVPSGNQHEVDVVPVDADGAILSYCLFKRSITDDLNGDVVDLSPGACGAPNCPDGSNPCDTLLNYTAQRKNGFETVNYNFKGIDSSYGSASVDVNNTVAICENPWPNPFPPANQAFPYEDSNTNCTLPGNCLDTNFSTFYCRDGSPLLPTINYPLSIVKPGNWSGNGKDELIKEFFFTRSDSSDAIGIRVMENEENLSPEKWYYKQFGPAAPSPSSLEVDGYSAIRAGRTVYVGATNLSGATIYNNIYLISYNEDASNETLNIYNQLLANWRFNTNMSASNKTALQRDIRRINDLKDIYLSLLTYKEKNKKFPLLAGGTYLQGFSSSVWPSWQETLGKDLGRSLPNDPMNNINCNRCWNLDKEYQNSPYSGLDIDNNGNVYLTDYVANAVVERCDAELNNCTNIFTGLASPEGLGLDKTNGDVLVAETGANRILRIDENGGGIIGTLNGFHAYEVISDNNGKIFFVTGDRVYRYSNDLTTQEAFYTFPWAPNPVGAVPWGLGVDKDNNIYVATYGMNRILKLNNDLNAVLDTYGNGTASEQSTYHPLGVDVDDEGRIYVVEYSGQRAFVLDSAMNNKLAVFGSYNVTGNDRYHLDHPYRIKEFHDYVYIADRGNNRVMKLKKDFSQCNACWDEVAKSFQCLAGSHIYLYELLSNGDNAALYANLEYLGAGSWASAPDSYTNCPTPSSCRCFNYQLNATGSLADHEGPAISPFNLPNTIANSVDVVLTINDLPLPPQGSGVAYVEFYVDGIRQATDNDSSNGWSWTWNTTRFADGAHEFKVIAYDKAGNHSIRTMTVSINNNNSDTKAPSVFIISPSDGATVSGNSVAFSVEATDNVGVAGIILSVINSSGTVIHTQTCTNTTSCLYTWNTTSAPDPNGDYTLQATASDGTNSTTKTIKVTLKNTDIVPPTISIIEPATTPVTGTGKLSVTANASDNVRVTRVEFLVDGNVKYTDVNPYGHCSVTETTACLINNDCPGTETCVAAGWSWEWDTALVENGAHTLQARAWDGGNNSALSDSDSSTPDIADSITVNVSNASNDKVPPDISFIEPPTPPAGSDVSATQTIAVSASDNYNVVRVQFYLGANLQFQDNGAPWTWTWQTTTTPNDFVQLRARAYDQAGNWSEVTRLLNVNNVGDLNPPVVNITAPLEEAQLTGSVSINANASEMQAGDTGLNSMEISIYNKETGNTETYACAVVSGSGITAPVPCTYNWNTAASPNGSYAVIVRATDIAGNIGANSVNVTVINSLLVSFLTPANGATVSGTTPLSASVTGATGSVTVYYNYDLVNRVGQSTSSPNFPVDWNTTTVSNGAHTLLAFAQDSLGAQGSAQITVTVNNAALNQPPNITAFSINGGAAYTNSTNVTLNITATDDSGVAEMQFSNDGSSWLSWQAYNTTATWTLPVGDGSKTVYARVRDNGAPALESGVASDTITLDTTPPTVAFAPAWIGAVSTAGNWVGGGGNAAWPSAGNGTVTVLAEATDALSGVSIVEFYLDGNRRWTLSAVPPYEWNWGADATPDGDHTLSVRAYDSAGNSATTAGYLVHLGHCHFSTAGCGGGTYCCMTEDPNICKLITEECFFSSEI